MMVGAMGQAAQFGAPLGEYRAGGARIWYIIGSLVLLALAAVFALMAISTSDTGTIATGAILGALFLAGTVYLFWLVIQSFGTSVQLFERGFVATQKGRTTAAAWGDVSSITQQIVQHRYRGIKIWTSHNYRLTLNSGEKLRFTEVLAKAGQMGEIIQRQITHELTPRALDAVRGGATLPFGKFSVNAMGITAGADTLAWSDIKDIVLQNGIIVIGKVNKRLRWNSAQVSKTPNAYVFLSLVDIMRRNAAPTYQPAPRMQ